MKRTSISSITLIALLALVLASCSIPFSYTTDESTTTIPAVLGYGEQLITTPSQTQNPNLAINDVTLNYSIANTTPISASVRLYIGLETATDLDSSDASLIIDETVPSGGTVTGSVKPPVLALALKQTAFVIGAENLSGTFASGSVIMTYTTTVDGALSFLK